jgi:pimeloyl-ACP methyl ester carboxylesterase
MKLSKTLVIAGLPLLAALASFSPLGAASPSAAPPPAPAASAVTFEPIRFQPASGEAVPAEMGTLAVPASRSGAAGQTIRLKFVRFRSISKTPGPPIVYLAGGPGGSGIEAAKGPRFPLFLALREHGDVIALDQRGTGASEPKMDCPDLYFLPFDKPLDRAESEAILAAGMKRCFERLRGEGIEPNAFTTLESAHDLDDLRQGLGVPKISLWAISYGTHLALATLKAHGEGVDRAILAGVEPLANTLKTPGDQELLLESIAGLVRQDPALAKVLPDLRASVARVLERLRRKPETVILVHPVAGQAMPITVGPLDLQTALAGMLEGPATFAGLPDFVVRLEKGDWTALALDALRFRASRLPNAMSVAMDCASGASPDRLARIEREAKGALLGDAINVPFPGICQGLGVPDLGDGYRQAFSSRVPVLLISGTLDGRTPPANADEVAKGFAGARRLVIEGAGHSDPLFLSSPKILEAMRAFLAGRKIASERIALGPVRLLPPRTVVELPAETLARYVGTYRFGEGETRRIFQAGSLLYSQRGGGQPLPLRPFSVTEFFWEGLPGIARFEVGADGKATAMSFAPDGSGGAWKRGDKVE